MEESIIFLGLEVGSWADWVGIVVAFLTIFLTIRYYKIMKVIGLIILDWNQEAS